jgi:crotonobetainyl-CoA:carnitine CoA-transferase CaiB-like acyl-CoA transferase
MTRLAKHFTATVWRALDGPDDGLADLSFSAEGALPAAFPVTDFASAAIAAAGLAVAELVEQLSGRRPPVVADRRLSTFWFDSSLRPLDWRQPDAWDPISGDYRTKDGWIRLHTNAPHHRAVAESILGRHRDKKAMGRAVEKWVKNDLETAIVEAGGCAAEMRSIDEWAQHPQGRAVSVEPLAHLRSMPGAPLAYRGAIASRPLAGARVLDLTRVVSGPVATRFLSGYGADVLRIDPPGWNEPGLVPEVQLGKRSVRLDLKHAAGRRSFEQLLGDADILVHGYRPGALDRLGYDLAARRALAPGLIDVSLDAYGWSGPWAARRGFDSLVQMSAGIAHEGMRRGDSRRPKPLPFQALDHATGYFMAAAAVRGVTRRLVEGAALEARFSLARTAALLIEARDAATQSGLEAEKAVDRAPAIEETDWGEAKRLRAPIKVENAPMSWAHPAAELGSGEPEWR